MEKILTKILTLGNSGKDSRFYKRRYNVWHQDPCDIYILYITCKSFLAFSIFVKSLIEMSFTWSGELNSLVVRSVLFRKTLWIKDLKKTQTQKWIFKSNKIIFYFENHYSKWTGLCFRNTVRDGNQKEDKQPPFLCVFLFQKGGGYGKFNKIQPSNSNVFSMSLSCYKSVWGWWIWGVTIVERVGVMFIVLIL